MYEYDEIEKMFEEFEKVFSRPRSVVVKYYDPVYTHGTTWCIDAQENITTVRNWSKKLADHIDEHVEESWASQMCPQCFTLYDQIQGKKQKVPYRVRKCV
jgi:hypothetical protein